jgi:myo-inositol-1-phosphate synthase
MTQARIGIDLIGAKGSVATTAVVGLTLLQKGLMPRNGLVSELPAFQGIGLPDWGSFVVAGHEIRRASLFEESLWLAGEIPRWPWPSSTALSMEPFS